MSFYRHSEPLVLQYVWNAIKVIRRQRQIANLSRITKIIQKEHSYTPKEILHHIHRAVKDNMVVETISVGCKGSKTGMEQEGYWIPEALQMLDIEATHDWYCFKCHKPGDMVKCSGCVVAYHRECIDPEYRPKGPKREKSLQYCKYCQYKRKSPVSNTASARQILNKCLGFVAQSTLDASPELGAQPDPKEYTHYEYFIKEHQDLNDIIKACGENKFEVPTDFMQKIELIHHNCIILHGEKHPLTEAASKMMDTCQRELKELLLCKTCYLQSNTKATKDWFCVPCRPPHQVVWAKQRGFEFWPAKVIQAANGKADVRFFGGHHERAWVSVECMKSIVLSPSHLQIKMTKSWMKANEEMKEYIRQTEKMFGSNHAAQIVRFDFQGVLASTSQAKKKGEAESEQSDIRIRAMKRNAEMAKCRVKKRKLKASANDKKHLENEAEKPIKMSLEDEDNEVDINTVEAGTEMSLPGQTLQSVMPELKNQLKIFGQKAKLNEECARTWAYGTELIRTGLLRVGYKQAFYEKKQGLPKTEDRSSQTVLRNVPEDTKKWPKISQTCSCSKRFERVLSRYKACVRRMRREENRRILTTATLYIKRKLKAQDDQILELESEILRLKEENLKLKQVIPPPTGV